MVKATLRERRVPIDLVRKTKRYYDHYLHNCSDLATERRILAELCPPLRTAAGLKWGRPSLTTAPHQPPWLLRRLLLRLSGPKQLLGR